MLTSRFSPDGRRLVTASVDQTARLWDAETGEALSEAMRHDGRVVHAEFSRAGDRVLTASWDKTIKVWEVRSGPSPDIVLTNSHWVATAYVRQLIQHGVDADEDVRSGGFKSEDLAGRFRLGGATATNERVRQQWRRRQSNRREADR